MNDTAIVVRAVIMHRGAVLLLRRALDDDYRPGEWDLPGGGWAPEDGTYQEGIAREVSEEAGLILPAAAFETIELPENVSLTNDSGRERHVYLARIAWWRSRPKVIVSDEHAEGGWYPGDKAVTLLTHPYYGVVLESVVSDGKR